MAMEPAANVEGGTRYLGELAARYHNDLSKALAAYNADQIAWSNITASSLSGDPGLMSLALSTIFNRKKKDVQRLPTAGSRQ